MFNYLVEAILVGIPLAKSVDIRILHIVQITCKVISLLAKKH